MVQENNIVLLQEPKYNTLRKTFSVKFRLENLAPLENKSLRYDFVKISVNHNGVHMLIPCTYFIFEKALEKGFTSKTGLSLHLSNW